MPGKINHVGAIPAGTLVRNPMGKIVMATAKTIDMFDGDDVNRHPEFEFMPWNGHTIDPISKQLYAGRFVVEAVHEAFARRTRLQKAFEGIKPTEFQK